VALSVFLSINVPRKKKDLNFSVNDKAMRKEPMNHFRDTNLQRKKKLRNLKIRKTNNQK